MRKLLTLLPLLVLGLFLSACSGEPTVKEEVVQTEKTIRVATNIPYSPFEYEENGQLVGFDMEIVRAIGEALNWHVEIQNEDFDAILPKINEGDYDLGIAALSINEERAKTNDFSDGYFASYQLIIVRESSEAYQLGDLNGLKIAVQEGTTGQELVYETFGKDYPKVHTYSDNNEGIEAFISGEVDAFIADNSFIFDYLKNANFTDYALIKDSHFPYEQFGIFLQKGNTALQEELNKGIAIIQENGVYDAIYTKYFGN